LGGRDVTADSIEKMAQKSLKSMREGKLEKTTEWFDLKE